MSIKKPVHGSLPRNAWVAAKTGGDAALVQTDYHDAKFLARYVLTMMVIFVGVALICIFALALMSAMKGTTDAILHTVPV